uniref:Uncharacterized protein n=1 Tax=Fagus sylvatica TaxID=28930 RepID=A0A2N9GSM8_FAGSY
MGHGNPRRQPWPWVTSRPADRARQATGSGWGGSSSSRGGHLLQAVAVGWVMGGGESAGEPKPKPRPTAPPPKTQTLPTTTPSTQAQPPRRAPKPKLQNPENPTTTRKYRLKRATLSAPQLGHPQSH